MSTSIFKTLHQIRSAIRKSPTHCLYFSGLHPFSSSLESIDQIPNQQHSFTVNYLVNSCGFTLEKAITASERRNFETQEKPDSVVAFFCNHGFTKTQASNLIRKFPGVLLSNPEKTLLPKLEFFKAKGFSSTDVAKILTLTPELLFRSLKNQIVPSFNVLKNLFGSEERTLSAIKRFAGPLVIDLKTYMAPNVEILREAGVPDANIAFLITYKPRSFKTSRERFKQAVEELKGRGLNPLRVTFVLAVHVKNSLIKTTWEKKIEVYKKWGLSEDEILVAFGKYPWFMMVSEDKIMRVMDFLVNKMGLESSVVSNRPQILTTSFERKIVPRCLLYQELLARGLLKKTDISLKVILGCAETWFIKKVVYWTKEEAPELLKLYKENSALASSTKIRKWAGDENGLVDPLTGHVIVLLFVSVNFCEG